MKRRERFCGLNVYTFCLTRKSPLVISVRYVYRRFLPVYCYTFLKVNTTSVLLCLCDPEWKLGKIFMGLFPLIFYRIKSRVVEMLRVFS